MRILCTFKTDKIPINYRMTIVSIVKEALKASDESYYQKLYRQGKRTKPFVFSVFLKNFEYEHDEIRLDELTIILSSPDYEFLLNVYNGLQKNKEFLYKHYQLSRKKMSIVKEKQVGGSKVVFRTLSPILVEDEQGLPVSPNDPSYEKHINHLANLILFEYRGVGLFTPLLIRPLKFRKMVVKESNREFESKFGHQSYLYFTAYHGFFEITGHPNDLQLLYQLGLSKRRNQGFGMLEVEEVKG
ncbi:CRISPR-associated endoribonuclease Cas6 [Anoxybacillus rupiensis]|uniref:CRISPR-associated endoribonuclease Cas6 n=1 Tax=Anoxybacteroides rupiense TaxID=311460 RepID=A0ABT5W364_9BACL|nr:CRISPR-associated endoribonuclease Cas6 [Anoxybacillus rupiensis]MBS2769937.1 CRISPR-associated endoribonuclease Cas6 [Anoxybacillus rupiensis]MDE8562691.1 CRISPR-associated endoribonuclease Cas6 [Anoxybacillus rupiensis]